jgi:ABC-2 type transport system permease protein
MFLMFALNGTATSLFEEKRSGMFQRLLAAPVTRAQILWSRFLFGIILGLVQLVTVFFVGSLLYGIDVIGHLGNLTVICIAVAAACTALGMFITSVSDSQEAAIGLATLVVLTMSACGGAWFPISFMPEFMQQIARFTITYWAMDGFSQVLWAGKSFLQILPTVGVLLAITAGVMGLAIWRFNRGRLLD